MGTESQLVTTSVPIDVWCLIGHEFAVQVWFQTAIVFHSPIACRSFCNCQSTSLFISRSHLLSIKFFTSPHESDRIAHQLRQLALASLHLDRTVDLFTRSWVDKKIGWRVIDLLEIVLLLRWFYSARSPLHVICLMVRSMTFPTKKTIFFGIAIDSNRSQQYYFTSDVCQNHRVRPDWIRHEHQTIIITCNHFKQDDNS